MDEQKLTEMYEFTKENNHMLKAMRRDAFIGGIVKFVVWVVLFIVLPYIAWLFIQPYLQGVLDTYQNVQKTTSAVSNTTSVNLSKLDELLKKFGGGQ
ncbi:hypothetical protein EPO14_02500 [Patescibacteria group bacterium]|nr:MAG: hypothetical protein EPO14_02500 [Patescibacteria group bacterium]